MDERWCRGCGRDRVIGEVLSVHRTSEGAVVYDRCGCGRAGVRLVPSGRRLDAAAGPAERRLAAV